MAPSTIGKILSPGRAVNFCPTRWRSSLSSRMTSGLKYLSIGRAADFYKLYDDRQAGDRALVFNVGKIALVSMCHLFG